MDKRQFLAPLAVSIAVLLSSNSKADVLPRGTPAIAEAVASSAQPSSNDFVIERNGASLAQQYFHESHASHESHSSHSSHRSGY
jgi:hypothetical protein